MLKRYLETSCDTLADAAAAFDRLKQARKLVRRLKNSFENTVLNINPEDICSLNPTLFTNTLTERQNQPDTECSSHSLTPKRISLMKVEEQRTNPFAPRVTVTCTHPSGFWKKSSPGSTVLEQSPTSSEDVVDEIIE